MLRDGRDHFNKGATLLPGKMHVLENTTNFTLRRSNVSQGNFLAYTDLVKQSNSYLDTLGYISYLKLIHLGLNGIN